ncbi:YchJ family protein [Alteromonas ponticola]|uniref:YchJ family protein n=1 Tax=Alteromonas ponticola TaxID=2720613 RepID=A0ABX1QWP2_9ALTE|nr:YchJ family protein [Alteromonas ponticola]NMH58664.1 YchJ family protein [Alteromonas ponticola]
MTSGCYCGSGKDFSRCCQPILQGEQPASTAETLMRSRYSAYCTKNYSYILNTYAEAKQAQLTEESLANSAKNTVWLHLDIESGTSPSEDLVEFKAWSKERNSIYLLHETSRFIKEKGQWRYLDGELHSDCGKVALGRNDPCLCHSGKKFKQCCLRR